MARPKKQGEAEAKQGYRLKDGVEIRPFGPSSLITNENLTDAMAEYLIESGKASEEDFE